MKAALELTASLGLDAFDQDGLYGHEPAELRRMAGDLGIKIVCYTDGVPLAAPPGDRRDAAIEQFKRNLDITVALGAPMMMVPIGGNTDVPREQSRAWAIDALARAVPIGASAGVTVMIEHGTPVSFPFLRSDDIDEALLAVPGLMLTHDNGNVLTTGEDPALAFRRHAARTAFVHFKDWDRSEGGWLTGLDGKSYRPALIGEGLIDYRAAMRALLDTNYAGYINLEYEDNRIHPFEAIRKAHAFLKSLEAECAAKKS